jgi:hypothetical protein
MMLTTHDIDPTKLKTMEQKQAMINDTWNALANAGRLDETGFRYRNGDKFGRWNKVAGAFHGQTVIACAAGPSISGFDLNKLDGKLSIGCNHMIETYDRFTWFIFQDQRFLKKTTYDLHRYGGLIFAHNNTHMDYRDYENLILFKSAKKPGLVQDGIYPRYQTGVATLHLAILSGAKKIYLLGHDNPKSWDFQKEGRMHGIEGYTGEVFDQKAIDETAERCKAYASFMPFKSRIINVCEDGILNQWFNSISMEQFEKEIA